MDRKENGWHAEQTVILQQTPESKYAEMRAYMDWFMNSITFWKYTHINSCSLCLKEPEYFLCEYTKGITLIVAVTPQAVSFIFVKSTLRRYMPIQREAFALRFHLSLLSPLNV